MKQAKLLFLLAAFLGITLSVSAQKVTLNLQNKTLEVVLDGIAKHTGYVFYYTRPTVNPDKIVSINVKDAELKSVLTQLFSEDGVGYEIKDKKIYLVDKQSQATSSQERPVSGRVVDKAGNPIIGATIIIQGTTTGASTDVDGNFTLPKVSSSAVLEFASLGYTTQTMAVGVRTSFDVTLEEDNQLIDNVVVTAMGIKRSEKALSYNVQKVGNDALTKVKDVNFVNSLSGKVAGVTINSSSSGVGGASKVIMRGTKSISQSSNTLYVIDGVPMFNYSKEASTEFGSEGSTEAIADLNPEDIESLSVLTGAAAAALYGNNASNGAIVITTKKGKAGQTTITVSSNTEVMSPFVMPKFQTRYGTGVLGSDTPVTHKSWGERLNSDNYVGYKPSNDYFQTGVVGTETVALSTGSERNQTYVSASAVNSRGIVPNNGYSRYNFTFRNTTTMLHDKMTLDIGGSYINQYDRNMINQGTYSNPLVTAYLFPRGDDWNAIKMYEHYDPTRKIPVQYFPQKFDELNGQNPYWINYRNLRETKRDRYMMNANVNYQILDWLSVSGRLRIDNATGTFTEKLFATSNATLIEGSNNGLYGVTDSKEKQAYGDLLLNINKTFGEDWSLQANVGGSFSDMRWSEFQNRGPIIESGLANVFNVMHLDDTKTERIQNSWHDQTQSAFGSFEVGYKGAYYLTLTARNDWPSQLSGPHSVKKSFFYPSVGASVVFSEIINMPKQISYLKLRASYASVGLPFSRFLANVTYKWNNDIKQWETVSHFPMGELKPEKTDSYEIGLTARFLRHFDLDFSLYRTNTKNQTFGPELNASSGYDKMYIQTGNVRNQGLELSVGYKNTWNKFSWRSNFTLSANRNEITELVENYPNPISGELMTIENFDVGGLGRAHFILRKGGSLGDLYSYSDLRRDSDGRIYVDENGGVSVASEGVVPIKMGSVFPKANMAWRNDFDWGNFNFGFMVSARIGGIVYSATQAALDYHGVSEVSAAARDAGGVLLNDNDMIDPYKYFSAIGGQDTGIPIFYTYSATNVRLQEASIGYTIPKQKLGNIVEMTFSIVGRNLLMIYNKDPFDPESVATTGNYYQGIDNFMMPGTRNIGFNVRLKF